MKKENRYHTVDNKIERKFTIKEIFQENWDEFKKEMNQKGKPIRSVINKEVEKIIDCQNPKKGHAIYLCPECDRVKHVPFTCKSRFCNTCGAKYSSDRALNMSAKLIDCEHRHVVFTIAEELRPYFAYDRTLLSILFEAVADTLTFCFAKRNKSLNFTPGFISVLHTFGRDLKWNPHIHVILSTDAISDNGFWKSFKHINYEGLRRSWQFCLLKLMSEKIKSPDFKKLVDKLYAEHKAGFYVYAPPIKHFSSAIVNYIVRYAGRPVLAQSRIKDYNGSEVTYTYTPHDSDELVTETIAVFDFIKRLIIHIPDMNFKMIRYYGFYSNKHRKYAVYLRRAKKMDPANVAFYKRLSQTWHMRIRSTFFYDSLKCICGGRFELIDIFYPPPYKNRVGWIEDTSLNFGLEVTGYG